MGRSRKIRTPEQRIARLVAWAAQTGLRNVEAELRQVLIELEQRQARDRRSH